jgi:ferredoxin, 2Fe-2S
MVGLTALSPRGDPTEIQALPGASLMEALRAAGVEELLALCGGCCACATCHVQFESVEPDYLVPGSEAEDELLDAASSRTERSRLSCQVIVDDRLEGAILRVIPE